MRWTIITISSDFAGHDEFGHARFETKRSELGELLYRLKYGSDQSVVGDIVEAAAAFVEFWKPEAGMIVPVPASKPRAQQPVRLLAEALGKRLGLAAKPDAVQRVKIVPELKDIFEYGERVKLLQGVHAVNRAAVEGQGVLLFDDLFRPGATLNAITEALYEEGKAREVFALTITRTRSKS